MTENFEQLLEETGFFEKEINLRGIQELLVTDVTHKYVIVDMQLKSEGSIPADEFPEKPSVGDYIPVYVDMIDNGHGQPVISYTKALNEINKKEIIKSIEEKDYFIEVTGSHATPVGIVCRYNNIEIFIPYTLLSVENKSKEYFNERFIGEKFKIRVIKADFELNQILGSHKAFIENEKGISFEKLVDEVNVGDIYEVPLNVFKKYGVFTKINGYIDTLIKIDDIGWKSIDSPQEFFGDAKTTKVMVTEIDHDRERVSVSHKLANTEVWDNFVKEHKVVVNIQDNFIIVRYNDEIDLMLHRTEVSEQKLQGILEHLYEVNNNIKAVIKNIDEDSKKINLTIKAIQDDSDKPKVGDVVTSKVVEKMENGIRLVNSHYIIWVPKNRLSDYYNQKEVLESINIGDELDVKVLDFKNDIQGTLVVNSVWDGFNLERGDEVDGFKVKRINRHNVLVENEKGFQGFVKINSDMKVDLRDVFSEGEELGGLIFKSKDKNNYLHFEVEISHDNSFKNPKIGDLM